MKKLLLGLITLASVSAFACGPDSNVFCRGEIAMANGYDATILRFLENGRVELQFLLDESKGVFSIKELTKVRTSTPGFNTGDTVVMNGHDAIITRIYDKGNVRLKFNVDASEAVYPLSKITQTLKDLNGWNIGDKATYFGYESEIKTIYLDGTARVKIYATEMEQIVPLKDLKKLIEYMPVEN